MADTITHTGQRWLCFTEAKVEGIMLKGAWQWGSDSCVVEDTLGKPESTQL
jgi:hypothetical protein